MDSARYAIYCVGTRRFEVEQLDLQLQLQLELVATPFAWVHLGRASLVRAAGERVMLDKKRTEPSQLIAAASERLESSRCAARSRPKKQEPQRSRVAPSR